MEPLNLWNKNFILLWLGNAQSGIGNTFYIIALSYLMLELTGSPKYTAFTLLLWQPLLFLLYSVH